MKYSKFWEPPGMRKAYIGSTCPDLGLWTLSSRVRGGATHKAPVKRCLSKTPITKLGSTIYGRRQSVPPNPREASGNGEIQVLEVRWLV